ncbi:hypothetical protein [Loigolactobacillus backii]|uniref:hypothetical protein n=1 Tax=Loigolactobacillus backii TaxID=375175 RepID=UPI000A6F0CB0|nr:hypothetical protein [Loigolactobacillus backii]
MKSAITEPTLGLDSQNEQNGQQSKKTSNFNIAMVNNDCNVRLDAFLIENGL